MELLINNKQESLSNETELNSENTQNDDYDTLYKTLLNDLYSTLDKNSNILLDNSNVKISKPDVHFDITKKTIWKNFRINCNQINRTESCLQTYFQNEYSTTTTINIAGQLLIKGRYDSNIIGSTYKKYIKNNVQCSICKSLHTEVNRNIGMRLDYLKCNNCNAEKVIVAK